MNWFDMINRYYNSKVEGKRLWEIDRVKTAVELDAITREQFKEITNEDYIE
ncbi:MAG: XkdX family protein [Romboutsia sp.]